ncbi:MAG: GNAT family N-acetyltransferase [Chloroflexi bacterium]|nr:GNAT family N-acetyltransferase [Chloroflexota bacterium]
MNLGNPDSPVGGLAVPRPEGVEIRPLGRDDGSALQALGFSPGAAFLGQLVGDVDCSGLLATHDDEPTGLIDFRFRRRLNHATFEGWVGDLRVVGAHRGRGIGRALLAAAIAEWRLRGGHQVEVELRRDQSAAFGLFGAAGFSDLGKFYEIAPVAVRAIEPAPGVEIARITDDDADFESTTRLLAELGRPAPTDEKLPALRRTFAMHVARAETGSMLARADGRAVGFISLEFRRRLVDGLLEAWIPDLIVTEAARGRDIGAALLDAAFAEALTRGAVAAKLESGSQRLVAHRLYEVVGMADAGSYLTLPR